MFNFTFVSKLNYPSKKQFSQEILPELVEKTSRQYVLLALANHFSTTASFDLWISKGVYDFFALVINFLSNDWQPKRVTIGLFGMTETIDQALARSLTKLLDKYNLRKNISAYVKDEGSNFNAMNIA